MNLRDGLGAGLILGRGIGLSGLHGLVGGDERGVGDLVRVVWLGE